MPTKSFAAGVTSDHQVDAEMVLGMIRTLPSHNTMTMPAAWPVEGKAGSQLRDVGKGWNCGITLGEAAVPRPPVVMADASVPGEDRRRVINYEKVVAAIRQIAASGHIDLCEGFAARICDACFADPRVGQIRVEVEKLDIFADAEAVGTVLERARPS